MPKFAKLMAMTANGAIRLAAAESLTNRPGRCRIDDCRSRICPARQNIRFGKSPAIAVSGGHDGQPGMCRGYHCLGRRRTTAVVRHDYCVSRTEYTTVIK